MAALVIAFMLAWCLRTWWDGRRADYRNPDNRYRRCLPERARHRAGQRYTAGWCLFQLRHGWGPMVQDVRDGWDGARTAQRQRRDDGDAPRGLWEACRDGWCGARAAAQAKTAPKPDPQQETTPGGPDAPQAPTPRPQPATSGRTAKVIPINPSGGTVTTMTGEGTGITLYRIHLEATAAAANVRIDQAHADIAEASAEIQSHERVNADLLAAGLGQQTTGGMADLMEAAQARLDAARGTLAAAERAKSAADQALAALDTQGHTAVEESVKSTTAPVADTRWYRE